MYGWSKWGGATMGIVKEELDTWYCQICGQQQVKELPSYMFPVDEYKRDYVRICSKCKSKAVVKKVVVFTDLLKMIKQI